MPTDRRWLDRAGAAARISVQVHELPRLVRAGKLPQPSYHLGPRKPRWDSLEIDRMFGAKSASVDDLVARGADAIAEGRYAGGTKAARGRHGQNLLVPAPAGRR